jgi:hypothetical protein
LAFLNPLQQIRTLQASVAEALRTTPHGSLTERASCNDERIHTLIATLHQACTVEDGFVESGIGADAWTKAEVAIIRENHVHLEREQLKTNTQR